MGALPEQSAQTFGLALALAGLFQAAGCAGAAPRSQAAPESSASHEPLVDVLEAAPNVQVDIRYATANNFTRRPLYPVNRCLLRTSVAGSLSLVQSDLARRGLSLKVWDCYRPLSIQRALWELVGDPKYVADPKEGSRHNRGAAVDVTLVDAGGRELEMPTGYDDFSVKAHRDWAHASPAARRNREILESAMRRHGFSGLPTEWWHFDAPGWRSYPVLDVPLLPQVPGQIPQPAP